MTTHDLVSIFGNLSQSLYPVQKLITGGAYLFGILFFVKGLISLRKIGERHSQEKLVVPMMYIFFGVVFIYLPTAMRVMANTAFGVGNVLTYGNYGTIDIYSSMGVLIRTAGLIWFVRGCALVIQAGQPGAKKEGSKGLVFILAGILAINFDNTVSIINSMLTYMMALSLKVKASQGY